MTDATQLLMSELLGESWDFLVYIAAAEKEARLRGATVSAVVKPLMPEWQRTGDETPIRQSILDVLGHDWLPLPESGLNAAERSARDVAGTFKGKAG